MTDLKSQQFVDAVEGVITDFYDTRLMDLIDELVDKFRVDEGDVLELLGRVDTSMDLEDAWREYIL